VKNKGNMLVDRKHEKRRTKIRDHEKEVEEFQGE
jgi:hypothetical protein